MNERNIAEIRRRMRPDKHNIGRIRGCYVNDNHNIISEFNQSFGMISTDEAEEVLSHVRKTLSGSIGRNLIDISFSNQQVLDSDEHRLLMNLRNSSLADDDAVKAFYEKVISSVEIEGSYFIFLANDKYDIFSYNENGEKNDSTETFSYIICAICPIKNSKPSLGYSLNESKFKNVIRDTVIAAPELGFMFPAFESNGANIYEALFYTRDISLSHEGFITTLFKSDIPRPASEQVESIANILNGTVTDSCGIELIQSIQAQLIELTADHKANKEDEPLMLSSKDMNTLLRFGGVKEEAINNFSEKFEEDFGPTVAIPPENIMNIKKFEVKTPEVTVKVSPECSELIQTRIIDGTKYLLIRADGDVEVNGIKININE